AGPELYDWAADHIQASQTDHIFNKAAVMQMLVDHRAGVTDNSRRIWNVLVAMIWHGIFVEKRIVPEIEEQEYALRL
ncbi:MAG: asparagine synthetase B, partial [Nocardiaceae bacterium]|nr:asparagine synthetase B [Nocardiaceae bacterium]